MPYHVRWQLIGRSERPLDRGDTSEAYEGYGEAVGAINEFLRPYPEVKHCHEEGYWLARRSHDADIVLLLWIDRNDSPEDCIPSLVMPADAPF